MVPKLFQWLIGVSLLMSVWFSLVFGYVKLDMPGNCLDVVQVMPLYLLMCFACYSLAVVGYRVATFNDCVDASEELKRQVKEARADLKKKGFKYAD
ncbi:dolichol-phosphate mannosyltransferase subunit 3-like [Haliotis rufescens]|uniref:dolichol-phosphate mannosyltransferase subunit 3-like n=1 Tax=Haliotis rufescens TaxID=6454 RepID=UPI00201F0035|nr:dolichol-phosphate mannosyltransferase subunit 3-like [Haliotis rufescens]